jgi:hypothetical protein
MRIKVCYMVIDIKIYYHKTMLFGYTYLYLEIPLVPVVKQAYSSYKYAYIYVNRYDNKCIMFSLYIYVYMYTYIHVPLFRNTTCPGCETGLFIIPSMIPLYPISLNLYIYVHFYKYMCMYIHIYINL